jgi:hypothetical protein
MAGIGEDFFKHTVYSRTRHFAGARPKNMAEPFKAYPKSK